MDRVGAGTQPFMAAGVANARVDQDVSINDIVYADRLATSAFLTAGLGVRHTGTPVSRLSRNRQNFGITSRPISQVRVTILSGDARKP